MSDNPIADLFTEDNVAESNWFKFEKVGDRIAGVLVTVEDNEGKGEYGPQRVFHLRQSDGQIIKVGISMSKDYVISRANTARMGDVLGFEYKKEVPSLKFKGKMAKSIEVYVVKAGTPQHAKFIEGGAF